VSGRKPQYNVSDKGPQFWCPRFKGWCKSRNVRPRFGAVGQHGSIAVIERFIKSLKTECVAPLPLVPLDMGGMAAELRLCIDWYNGDRPHEFLGGKTPDEVYYRRKAANTKPRVEPRAGWPRESLCAAPQAPVRGPCGTHAELVIKFAASREHLPLIGLKRTA